MLDFPAWAAWQAQKAHFDVCYAGYFSPTWPTWRFWGLSRYGISRKVRRGSRLFFKPLFLSPFIAFLRRFGRKTGIDFDHFGLDMVFEGTTGVCEPIHRFISKWVRKKEKYANAKCIWRNLFGCCFNRLVMMTFLRGQVWKWVLILEVRGPFLESPNN